MRPTGPRPVTARRDMLGRSTAGSTWRKPRIEALEDRQLLTAVPFGSLASQLLAQLQGDEIRLVTTLDQYATGQNSSLPFVGNHLGDAAKALSGFSQQIDTALVSLGTLTDPSASVLQNALFNALGPGGLNLLADQNGNGVDASDVIVTAPGGVLNGNFSVQMTLQGTVAGPTTPLTFATGLPGLPLKIDTDGALTTNVHFSYQLAFNYNASTQQATLDDSQHLPGIGHQIELGITVGLQNFSATATLGFVQGALTPLAGQANALSLTADLDGLSTTPALIVTGSAIANLHLAGSFAGTNNDFPGIDTDVHLNWNINSQDPNAKAPDISFDNVDLDLGKFISNVIAPVFQDIQYVTEPLNPIEQVLGYPLPGLSDLSHIIGAGDVTLLTLGGIAATVTGFGPLYDLLQKVNGVVNQFNQFDPSGATILLPLGGFDLSTYDLRNVTSAADPTNLAVQNLTDLSPSDIVGVAQSLAANIDKLPLSDSEKQFIDGFTSQLNNGVDLEFPILQNPAGAVFPLLLGHDTDLFTLNADLHTEAAGSAASGYSIFGVGIDYGGEVQVDTHFKFAYDTFGLRSLIKDIANDNVSAVEVAKDVAAGFYVDSSSYFKLAGDVYAGATGSLGVFSAVVGGFVSTGNSGNDPVSVTLDDPDGDGKVRLSDFANDPFHFSGSLTAALGVEVRVGFQVFNRFVGLKKRFDVANKVLVDFDSAQDGGEPDSPILASQPDSNGNINLYVGTLANQRRDVDQTDGTDQLRIEHVGLTDPNNPDAGETIDVTLRQKNLLGIEYDATQRIQGVKSITGIGDKGDLTIDVLPGVTSAVHLEGGQGAADFVDSGSGAAYLKAGLLDSYLGGGSGNNTLIGQGGADTIVLGSAGNIVTGGGGSNTIIVNAPTTQGGTISGGDDDDNTLVVTADASTADVGIDPDSDTAVRLTYDEKTGGTFPPLLLTQFNQVVVTAQDRGTNVHIGDLSPAGVNTVYVNIPTTNQGGRNVELDTRNELGESDISLLPFDHTYSTADGTNVLDHAIEMTNATTGVTTYLMGLAPADIVTISQHGGTATLGPLANDNGTVVFNTSQRPAGQSETVTMQTPALDTGNSISTSQNSAGAFVIDAQLYPTIIFEGLAIIDSIEMDIAAPSMPDGVNTIFLDASSLAGRLQVNLQGDGAVDNVSIAELAVAALIDVEGGTSSTTLRYGVGMLTAIAGDVEAHNVQLTIDDAEATTPSLLVIGATSLVRQTVPDDGARPAFTYDGLHGVLEVDGGAGDRVGLDQTPMGITSAYFTNPAGTQDALYVVAAAAALNLDGNWSLYLGRQMLADGTVVRTSQVVPIAVPVTLNYAGSEPNEIVVDAALDPTGAHYKIGGLGNVTLNDVGTGLSLYAANLKANDSLKLILTGATVDVSLPMMGPVAITVDGRDRFDGQHPVGANTINVAVPIGGVALYPTGTNDSVLASSDPIIILGSMPQDALNVTIATSTTIGINNPSPNQELGHIDNSYFDFFYDDAYYVAQTPASISPAFPVFTKVYAFTGFNELDVSAWASASFLENNYPAAFNPPYSVYVPYSTSSAPLVFNQVYNQTYTGGVNASLPQSVDADMDYFPVDPAGVNSDLEIDASQLRGSVSINVGDPDYSTANTIADMFRELGSQHVQTSTTSPFFAVVNNSTPGAWVDFGQTYVNVSNVGPQTTLSINGTNPLAQNANTPVDLRSSNAVINDPRTYVNLGEGDLSGIEGSVSVNQVQLSVDGRDGTAPDILQVTGTTITGWAVGTGVTPPTATLGTLFGTLTIIGGAADQFDFEATPAGPSQVLVENMMASAVAQSMIVVAGESQEAQPEAQTQPTPGVYVMGKQANQPFVVDGNFNLFLGRRLHADGSVEDVGDATGFTNLSTSPNFSASTQLVTYNYTGAGPGQLVYDASTTNVATAGLAPSIGADAAYPGQGEIAWDWSSPVRNKVVYTPNIELFVYAPKYPGIGETATINNVTTAIVHYIVNPQAPANGVEYIGIFSAFGPVSVTGRGGQTEVEIIPQTSDDLRQRILADVTVTNASLKVVADNSTSAAPASLPDVVLTGDELLGLTSAPIHFSQLADYLTNPGNYTLTAPGLQIGLSKFGASSLTIDGTPAGVTTLFATVDGVGIGPVSIVGTTGPLWLGHGLDTSTLVAVNGLSNLPQQSSRDEFRAASVTIGSGTLQNILGNVVLGGNVTSGVGYYVSGNTTIDDHADTARNVTLADNFHQLADNTFVSGFEFDGLATGWLSFYDELTSPVTILGSDGSSYNFNKNSSSFAELLFAGLNTTVNVVDTSNNDNGLTIYGAQQVTVQAPGGLRLSSSAAPIQILSSPDRPNQITNVIADFSLWDGGYYLASQSGVGQVWWSGAPGTGKLTLAFPAATTNFTLLGLQQDAFPFYDQIHILDTPAVLVTVNPGGSILDVQGTSNPLVIEDDGAGQINFGNASNMQALQGNVTVHVHDSTAGNVPVVLDDSADTTARSIALGQPAANEWTVAGMAPATIDIQGSRAQLSLAAGTGANTLTGPNVATTWNINAAGAGTVGAVAFSGMQNLVGGSANDDFYFNSKSSKVPGNLDGGPGTDTVHYVAVLNGTETINPAAGILPLVGGTASSIEAVDVIGPLVVQNPGTQIGRVTVPITPLQIVTTGGSLTKTYVATGLPTGLSIDANTGIISGTIAGTISPGTNFNVKVTVTDSLGSQSVSFIWQVIQAWSIVNPGNMTLPEGVPINYQVQTINPNNLPLTYSANGLPASLAIDPYTGIIHGSLYFFNLNQGRNVTAPITIFAYDATTQQTTSFTLTTEPGFALDFSGSTNGAGESIDYVPVYNPYGQSITLTATGLPPGLSVDANNRIVGTIDSLALQNAPYNVQLTAVDTTIGYTVTLSVVWNVVPSTYINQPNNQTSYAGSSVNFPLSITNEFNQPVSLTATGLPAGLTIDQSGVISGTISPTAPSSSPYVVDVTITNETVGYSSPVEFDWTVLTPISLAELNAGTPAGTPTLTTIIDPATGGYPSGFVTVSYASQPGAPTYVYYDEGGQLWAYNGQTTTAVQSVEPNYPTIDTATDINAMPGQGVLFLDSEYNVWFANQSGARVVDPGPVYTDYGPMASIGNQVYYIAFSTSGFTPEIRQFSLDQNSQPVVTTFDMPQLNNATGLKSFAGGVLFQGTANSDPAHQQLYWYNPGAGTIVNIATASQFSDITVVPGANGTQNVFLYEHAYDGSGSKLVALNSSSLSQPNPQVMTLASFNSSVILGSSGPNGQPLMDIGGQLVFSVTSTVNNASVMQFWTSDGTVAGTVPVGQALDLNGLNQQIAFQGDVYFFNQESVQNVTDTTSVSQLWKFDPTTGAATLLHDFVGIGFYQYPTTALTVAGDYLYFEGWNEAEQWDGLWRAGVDGTVAVVPTKADNPYDSPDLSQAIVANGQLIFVARSSRIVDNYGNETAQVWTVGPPIAAQMPGDFDGDDKVTAVDINTLWGFIHADDPRGDLNGDHVVDQSDMDYMIHVILKTEYGDANLDGFVDAADLAVVRTTMGTGNGTPNWAAGDFNGDGTTDVADLAVVRRNLGFASPATTQVATPIAIDAPAVPPPAPVSTTVTTASNATALVAAIPTVFEFGPWEPVAPLTAPSNAANANTATASIFGPIQPVPTSAAQAITNTIASLQAPAVTMIDQNPSAVAAVEATIAVPVPQAVVSPQAVTATLVGPRPVGESAAHPVDATLTLVNSPTARAAAVALSTDSILQGDLDDVLTLIAEATIGRRRRA